MPKKLKLWNGATRSVINYKEPLFDNISHSCSPHCFIAAYSREDARRLIESYSGRKPTISEIKNYFNEGCWGNSMEGIEPERGLWVRINHNDKPVRVV